MKDGKIKLGDFGIARVLSNTVSQAQTLVGTPYYLSPEIIESKPYSFKSDIWSLGILLYEMCALQPPFSGSSLPKLAGRIVKGKHSDVPAMYSRNLQHLINSMLRYKPNERPNINQICNSLIKSAKIDTRLPMICIS